MSGSQFTIGAEPRGAEYRRLIELGSGWCVAALLVVRDHLGLEARGHELLKALEPFKIRQQTSTEWPGTRLLEATAAITVVRLNPDSCRLLSTAVEGLYDWQQPELPEDLCLLRDDDEPWLVTIAHEGDAYVVPTESELAVLRDELPDLAASLRPDA